MAKIARRGRSKGGVNKAQAVRDEFNKQGITTAPKDVIAALTKRGITVAPAQVSNIRTSLKGGAKKRKVARRKAVGRKPAAKSASVSVDALIAAKKLVDRMGGVDEARRALDVLAQLK
jgi:hypothetical protein